MKHSAVVTDDGVQLSAHTFGDVRSARAAVLIVPAMGVEQQYYAPFAHWLFEQGYFARLGHGISRCA